MTAMSNPSEYTRGNFVTRKVTGPAIEVDCSDWVDTREGWTTGTFQDRKITGPAIEVDCSEWGKSAGWLEVVVSFDDTAAPASVFDNTLRLIHTLHEQYRREGIALRYDAARSRTEGERVIVALRMGSAMTEERRLRAVAIARQELARVPGTRVAEVIWPQAA